MEPAQAFRRLGSQVTIVAPRLLPHDDPEAGAILQRVFEREGVRWLRGRGTSLRQEPGGIVVASDAVSEAQGEALFGSAGRPPNIAGLALDRAGVGHPDRGLPVDDRLRTNGPH